MRRPTLNFAKSENSERGQLLIYNAGGATSVANEVFNGGGCDVAFVGLRFCEPDECCPE